VDQALAEVHDRAGAALVADPLAMGEQQVVEDRVVAQARVRLAHVDHEEVAELHVETKGRGVGGLGFGWGAASAVAAPPSRMRSSANARW
jgi:hypothetical protein